MASTSRPHSPPSSMPHLVLKSDAPSKGERKGERERPHVYEFVVCSSKRCSQRGREPSEGMEEEEEVPFKTLSRLALRGRLLCLCVCNYY